MLTKTRMPSAIREGDNLFGNSTLLTSSWAIPDPAVLTLSTPRAQAPAGSGTRRSRSEIEGLLARRLRVSLFPDGYL